MCWLLIAYNSYMKPKSHQMLVLQSLALTCSIIFIYYIGFMGNLNLGPQVDASPALYNHSAMTGLLFKYIFQNVF